MDEEDHEMLYNKMKKPTLESMIGILEGQLVSDFAWTEPAFRFRYYLMTNVIAILVTMVTKTRKY
jgi:hypothetical protein